MLHFHTVTLSQVFEGRQANQLFWAPLNDFLVLANVNSSGGNLEFINARMLESVVTGEHPNATDFEWDPRGRFFVSSCSAWRQQSDTGYFVWSFNGRLLAKVNKPKFFEFHWRPRPPTLLSANEEKKVIKNMKVGSVVVSGGVFALREYAFLCTDVAVRALQETSKLLEKEDELRRRLERREVRWRMVSLLW